MALHDPLPEPNEQLTQLTVARTDAIENDIRAGRASTITAVAELTGVRGKSDSLNCDVDEAEALVRAAVVGRSALVGARIAGVVQLAIYDRALQLAEQDLADIERNLRQSADEARIGRVLDARAARGAA